MTSRFARLFIVAVMAQLGCATPLVAADRSLHCSVAEERLLSDAADGRWDEHSLFAAAAIAGGARTDHELRKLENMFSTMSLALRTDLPPGQTLTQRAQAVLEFLHRRVFSGGYDLQATDPATVLASGRYNCVSATLFFNCLAREAELTAEAVRLPQHTRSVITDAKTQIAVEPTCVTGIDGDSLGRATTGEQTISDVALVAMIYYNRGVEALRRRDLEDAIQLNRLALTLDPENTEARGNLLAAINRRALELAATRHFESAIALFDAGLSIAPDHRPLQENRALVIRSRSKSDAGADASL